MLWLEYHGGGFVTEIIMKQNMNIIINVTNKGEETTWHKLERCAELPTTYNTKKPKIYNTDHGGHT